MTKCSVLVAIFLAFALLTTSCTTYNASHPSHAFSAPVTSNIKAKVEVGGDVQGESNVSVLFGLFTFGGDTQFADGVSYGSAPSSPLSSVLGGAVEGAKSAAALKAIKGGSCDFIVDPRYEINYTNYFVFGTYNVKVKGKAGKTLGYSAE